MSLLRSLSKSLDTKARDRARAKHNARRREVRSLKNAGVWEDVKAKYLDVNGNPKKDIEIPQWFLNLYPTWKGKEPTQENYNEWCEEQLDHLGIDPRKEKKPIGRPKLPDSKRKRPKRGRAAAMKELLEASGIHLTTPLKKYDPKYLVEHPTIEFLPNGRLRYEDGKTTSVFQFLKDLKE